MWNKIVISLVLEFFLAEKRRDRIRKPDIAGVTTPSAITIAVPARTSIKRSFFKVKEASSFSFIFSDLSNSADGTFNLKLDIRVSEGS